MSKTLFRIPKPLKITTIRIFLDEFKSVFGAEGRRISDVRFKATEPEFDLIGSMVLYKVIEYSVKNKCFANPVLDGYTNCMTQLSRFGFNGLIKPYFTAATNEQFSLDIKYQEFEGVFIAPFILKEETCVQEEHRYTPKIEAFYQNNTISHVIFQCMAEIMSNFSEHSQDDTDTVLVASGNKERFEIVCADTGIGIVSSLMPTLKPERKMPPEKVLEMSVMKGVTSKRKTNHMGYGLWLISQYVESQKGEMHLYSEGAFYVLRKGKVKIGRCGYWKGTIIYVSLPLGNLKGFLKVQNLLANEYDDIKVSQV